MMNGVATTTPADAAIYLIGGVTVDLIMGQVPPWPQPGTETFVGHSELRVGGPAGNSALALRALGSPYHLVCNIGDDMFGTWLAQSFGDAARSWRKVPRATAISVAIEHPGGERSFLTSPGNLAVETAQGILDAMPARAKNGDIALLTGAFLYPELIGAFDDVLEALAAARPVIATRVGGIPEIMGAGNIALANPDADALAGKLRTFLDDPDALATAMPYHSELQRRFSIDAMADSVMAAYTHKW